MVIDGDGALTLFPHSDGQIRLNLQLHQRADPEGTVKLGP